MADKRQTERRCENCLAKGKVVFMMAQALGENEQGEKQYRLDCPICFKTLTTRWDGK